eukprot:Skav223557  [mRNA]  locus=scaffold2197:24419:26719:- [translate_table: standard]
MANNQEESSSGSSDTEEIPTCDDDNDYQAFVNSFAEIKEHIREAFFGLGIETRLLFEEAGPGFSLVSVARFRRLCKRASGAKSKKLAKMKAFASKLGWPQPVCKQVGPADDIGELPLPSMSDSTTASDLSSGVSSVASQSSGISEKLHRVMKQLESISVSKSTSTRIGDDAPEKDKPVVKPSPVTPDERPVLVIPDGRTPAERVAEVLRRAKARRLAAASASDMNNVDRSSTASPRETAHDTEDVEVPDYVAC